MVWICACLVVIASLAVSVENGDLQGRQEVEQEAEQEAERDRYLRLARIQRVRRWVTIRVVRDLVKFHRLRYSGPLHKYRTKEGFLTIWGVKSNKKTLSATLCAYNGDFFIAKRILYSVADMVSS